MVRPQGLLHQDVQSIIDDIRDPTVGLSVFDRFVGGRALTPGHYLSLAEVYLERGTPGTRQFDADVAALHDGWRTHARGSHCFDRVSGDVPG